MSFLEKLIFIFRNKSAQTTQHEYVNRLPRIELKPLHAVYFRRVTPPCPDTIPLANISESGIGFFKITGQDWPARGEVVKGELIISGDKFSVALRIVRESSLVIGCAFVLTPTELKARIQNYFEMEISALALSEVKSTALKSLPEGTPRWFRGDNSAELYFIEDQGKITRFHAYFLGIYWEGGVKIPTQISYVLESPASEEIDLEHQNFSSHTHIFKNVPNILPEHKTSWRRFIKNISKLSDQEKNTLIFMIEGVPDDNE